MPIKVLFIFGTRPEAIKLCPVIRHMKSRSDDFDVRVCVTAQHREMLDQVLHAFDVTPDQDLDIMRSGQTLSQSTSRIIAALEPILAEEKPGIALVQGDTTTTFCGALAAFYAKIPVGHVEAGLRTGDPHEPFPEEMNRVLTGRIATFHFAATEGAAQNLYREGVDPAAVTITGNTGIDAVLHVKQGLDAGSLVGLNGFRQDASKKLIVVTAHRRESFGNGFEQICAALVRLARRLTPRPVSIPSRCRLRTLDPAQAFCAAKCGAQSKPPARCWKHSRKRKGGFHHSWWLAEPWRQVGNLRTDCQSVQPDVSPAAPQTRLTRRSLHSAFSQTHDLTPLCRRYPTRGHQTLPDSGGIQEAPSLGKPVLVLREKTERPEAISAGTARLAGTSEHRIVEGAEQLLDDPHAYHTMARRHNPYGDGKASERIAGVLASGTNEPAGIRSGSLVPVETPRCASCS